jgi:glycosyltransferase involved in cell wall biosynthesis
MWPIPSHPYYGIFVKEQIEGIEKHYNDVDFEISFINGKKFKLNYLLSIFKLNFKISNSKYDIIHIHFGLSGFFLLFNPFLKTPIVTTLHSADIDIIKSNQFFVWVSKQVVKKSKKVFYLNDKMLEILETQKGKLIYLPCGVNTDDFYKEQISSKKDELIIGFPANKMRPEKNYLLFEEIIKTLQGQLGIKISVVEFHNKNRREVRESLNLIDLLLMTSLSEGSPQIVKEALSCDTPVISSNVGDVKKILEGVDNCYLVDSFESLDYIEPIMKIIKNKSLKVRSTGRQQIFRLKLDEKSISERIYLEYNKLI